ncbi:hypothetical protein B0I35DRAFT_412022 [Stachybotrys elegans]|uniref:Uncharacterized protein n=1 Tax=Stachybotrys elegans TaxID=80388 RepID=A0A8K0WM79_9HYPO|nr:hypothetical protein B0I35DRAFT_412022 [Stachybotrys elegans]
MADGIAPAIDKVAEPAPGAPEAQAGVPVVVPSASSKDATETKAAVPDGAGPSVSPPKPVEVMSVPETPMENNTPAGGTPRPVLNLADEPTVTTGVEGPKSTPKMSAAEEVPEAAPTDKAVPGDKRKMGPAPKATNGGSTFSMTACEPADKKMKMNGDAVPKSAVRAKKEKNPPPIGRTARKTRSQGPVEV